MVDDGDSFLDITTTIGSDFAPNSDRGMTLYLVPLFINV